MGRKVWTSSVLTVDDQSARQSRRGRNPTRHKDGTLRADRPLPPNYTPRLKLPKIGSPRYEKKDTAWLWDDTDRYQSTHSMMYQDPATIAPLRQSSRLATCQLRNKPSEVGALIFGLGDEEREIGPLNGGMPNREPPVLPGAVPLSPRMQEVAALTPAVYRIELSSDQELRKLQAQIRAEERLTESARAHFKTYLRRNMRPPGM